MLTRDFWRGAICIWFIRAPFSWGGLNQAYPPRLLAISDSIRAFEQSFAGSTV
jgi:hypothetical protein